MRQIHIRVNYARVAHSHCEVWGGAKKSLLNLSVVLDSARLKCNRTSSVSKAALKLTRSLRALLNIEVHHLDAHGKPGKHFAVLYSNECLIKPRDASRHLYSLHCGTSIPLRGCMATFHQRAVDWGSPDQEDSSLDSNWAFDWHEAGRYALEWG